MRSWAELVTVAIAQSIRLFIEDEDFFRNLFSSLCDLFGFHATSSFGGWDTEIGYQDWIPMS